MYRVLRICLLPFRLIRRFATGLAILALLASLTFNVAVLTVTGVYTAASAALSAVGVTTVAAREAGEKLARRNATRKIGQETARKVTHRMQRGAARNIASVGGEAIPVLGVAVIAGALVLEINDACETAADMAGLEAALRTEGDPEIARLAAVESFDCRAMIREELPDYDALPTKQEIWDRVKSAPRDAYDRAIEAGIELREVDWSGRAGRAVEWVVAWAGSIGNLVTGAEEAEN